MIVLAVDGLEWSVLLPLVHDGEAPSFRHLMERGRYGLLKTSRPTFSPIIWTSVATGKTAPEHGIRGFVNRRARDRFGVKRLYNSLDRRTKAYWNILSDYDRSVAVIGWWMTFPVEPVHGVMVAQVNTLDQAQRAGGRAILKGGLVEGVEQQVYPQHRAAELLRLHADVVTDLQEAVTSIFGDLPPPESPFMQKLWGNTQWALRSDLTYLAISERIASEGFDLMAVYFGGADVVGHRFWRYMHPELYVDQPPPEEVADYGAVILDYYRFLDRALGSLLSAAPGNANVLVVADHGMHAENRDGVFGSSGVPEDVNSGHHHNALPGVVIAAGPDIEAIGDALAKDKRELREVGSIYDITPTILTLLRVPRGRDMNGQTMAGVRLPALEPVPTHDNDDWLASRARFDGDTVRANPQRQQQLRALGYID